MQRGVVAHAQRHGICAMHAQLNFDHVGILHAGAMGCQHTLMSLCDGRKRTLSMWETIVG